MQSVQSCLHGYEVCTLCKVCTLAFLQDRHAKANTALYQVDERCNPFP